MAKDKLKISHLNYGEIHMYYPIKFETKLDFSDLCDIICKSNISFNDEYQEKIMNSLGTSLANTTNELQREITKNNANPDSILLRVHDTERNKIYQPIKDYKADYKIDGDNIRVEFLSSNSSIYLNVVSNELEVLQQRLTRMREEFDISSRIYGNLFTSNQKRVLLLPFKAKLANGKTVWINAILIIFSNKMGILKLELPLIDTDISPLKNYDVDSLVNSIDNCWELKNFDSDIKLLGLVKYYLKSIVSNKKIKIHKYGNEIKNIVFVDFNEMPKQINSLSSELQEELFRIISAPVPENPYTSYSSDAQEHIKKYSLGHHGIKYIMKTNGGVLSIIDKNLFDYYTDGFKISLETSDFEKNQYIDICNSLAKNININIEFAILIIMLKKINEYNNFYDKSKKKYDLFKIRREFYQNTLFINELQNNCYGSVLEQISDIENMMPLYLKTQITSSNQEALYNILNDEQQRRNEHFINFISSGSIMLSLIFGLPSIYEAIKIIQKTLAIYNIPCITLENFSVGLWLLLNLFIIIKLLCKK